MQFDHDCYFMSTNPSIIIIIVTEDTDVTPQPIVIFMTHDNEQKIM